MIAGKVNQAGHAIGRLLHSRMRHTVWDVCHGQLELKRLRCFVGLENANNLSKKNAPKETRPKFLDCPQRRGGGRGAGRHGGLLNVT
jgi:hypothetical protein